MKTITKHIYSAGGYYIGCKQIPAWRTYIQLPTVAIIMASILLGIGVIVALNGLPLFNMDSSTSTTNPLPF